MNASPLAMAEHPFKFTDVQLMHFWGWRATCKHFQPGGQSTNQEEEKEEEEEAIVINSSDESEDDPVQAKTANAAAVAIEEVIQHVQDSLSHCPDSERAWCIAKQYKEFSIGRQMSTP